MKITIEDGKAVEVFYNGKYYKPNVEIDLPFEDAIRMKNNTMFKIHIDREDTKYDPSMFHDQKKVAFWANIDTISGWGNAGLNLIKYSAPYFYTSLIGKLLNVNDIEAIKASKRSIEPEMGLIIHEQPKEEWKDLPFDRKIAIVPFETTKCPQSWVSRINSCHGLIVPCQQNKKLFEDSGVIVPIEVVNWGTDTDKFYKIERPKRDIFTFGTMGALSKRKGTDLLVRAFLKAFPSEKDVRLICKTSNNHFLWATRDPRVQLDLTAVEQEHLMFSFFKEIDCFVFPTRGEGWGFPISEAMSTGAPVIVTNWSGPCDFVNEDVGWLIDYKMVPAEDFSKSIYKEDCGEWAEPDEAHLVQLMRYAYEHQDEVRIKGEAAAKHIRDNFTWEKTILQYNRALDNLL